MKMSRLAILLFLAAALAVPADADDTRSSIDRFRLWNQCKPIELLVESLPDDAAKIGLTKDAVLTTVRSRLRSARLFSDKFSVVRPYLYVHINIVSSAFSIKVEYSQAVFASGGSGIAATWRSDSTGVHGRGGSGFILSGLSQHVDKFIDEYLRVNASACKR